MLGDHGCWHFQCPECGMGDFELGHLANDHQFFCEVRVEKAVGWNPPGAMAGGRRDADLRPFAPRSGGLSSGGAFRLCRCR